MLLLDLIDAVEGGKKLKDQKKKAKKAGEEATKAAEKALAEAKANKKSGGSSSSSSKASATNKKEVKKEVKKAVKKAVKASIPTAVKAKDTDAEPADMKTMIDEFNNWFDEQSPTINKLYVAPVPGMRMGTFAKEDMKAEEVYLAVPLKAVMNIESADKCPVRGM